MLGGGFNVLTDQVDLDLSSCLVGEGKSENKPIVFLICVLRCKQFDKFVAEIGLLVY
jgi:hypothetical protein